LIAFSQYKLGGIQSYFYNLLSNDPDTRFNKTWIFHDDMTENAAKLPSLYGCCNEIVFPINEIPHETIYSMASRLNKLLPHKPGVVLSSFHYELSTLHLHRRNNLTVFFFCHDKVYLNNARRFEFLIDVFIAHNIEFYHEMIKLFPQREQDIYYMPYGVPIRHRYRSANATGPLKLMVLSRMDKEKGVWDIPVIEEKLKQMGVEVEWTLVGDGPERASLREALGSNQNFRFFSPPNTEGVMNLVVQNDVFVLPSRLDGLPVALLETMSAGLVPIISAFNEGIRQVVTPKEGFVLPVGDTDQFAATIAALHINRALLKELGTASREKIEAEYDVKKRAKEYYDLFSQYKQLKKRARYRFHKYAGWLDYPFVPRLLRQCINGARNLAKNN